MNHLLQTFARTWLKEHLAKLPESNQNLFKAMYSHRDRDRPIDAIVDAMPVDKLDWAMTQVENTLKKQVEA